MDANKLVPVTLFTSEGVVHGFRYEEAYIPQNFGSFPEVWLQNDSNLKNWDKRCYTEVFGETTRKADFVLTTLEYDAIMKSDWYRIEEKQ